MPDFSIRDFGSIGDGKSNDAAAIQKAIDECNKKGGGRVLVPAPSTYLTGAFSLKSNVELYIERGATIVASGKPDDYVTSQGSKEYSFQVIKQVTYQSQVVA